MSVRSIWTTGLMRPRCRLSARVCGAVPAASLARWLCPIGSSGSIDYQAPSGDDVAAHRPGGVACLLAESGNAASAVGVGLLREAIGKVPHAVRSFSAALPGLLPGGPVIRLRGTEHRRFKPALALRGVQRAIRYFDRFGICSVYHRQLPTGAGG
jgi:hypothetical protein